MNDSCSLNCTAANAGTKYATVAIIIALIVTGTILLLNLLSVIILYKTKQLRENKFYCQTLYLSITNIILSLACTILIGNTLLFTDSLRMSYICYFSVLLARIANLFSLIQVLFICIERLIATCSLSQNGKWTKKFSFLFLGSLVGVAIYITGIFLYFGKPDSLSCKSVDIFESNYRLVLLSSSGVQLLLLTLITIVYFFVLLRLRRRLKQVIPHSNKFQESNISCSAYVEQQDPTRSNCVSIKSAEPYTSDNQKQNGHKRLKKGADENDCHGSGSRIKRFKKTLFTLVLLIIVIFISILPYVSVHLVYSLTNDVISQKVLEFTDIFILIKPLFDPIIYVLRIQEFRNKVKCKRQSL